MKKIYSYDYEGKLVGELEAELCQLTELKRVEQKAKGDEVSEPVYILPAYSTDKAPPSEIDEGYEWKFTNGDWYASEIPKPVESDEPIREQTYIEKRAMEYPNFLEYIDGVVKQGSDDPEVQAEGFAQVENYINECLAVKKKFPKP